MTSREPAPSISRFVVVGDLRFHYLDFGDTRVSPGEDARPKMLCLHGGAAQAHWFDFVVAPFLEDYRVLSLDLRGHGDSDWGPPDEYSYLDFANDTGAFINALGIGPVVLAGHSMGGMVAVVTAAEYPDAVDKLVVIDSMMRMSEARAAALRGIGEHKGKGFESRQAYVYGFKIRPETVSASSNVIRHMAATSCRQFDDGLWRNKFDRNVYARRHPIDGYAYWARVPTKETPALVIAGGNSDRITPEVRDRLSTVHPGVTVTTVKHAGHHVTLDNPEGYIDALARHLDLDRQDP